MFARGLVPSFTEGFSQVVAMATQAVYAGSSRLSRGWDFMGRRLLCCRWVDYPT